MTAEPEVDLIESLSARVEIDQRRAEEMAGARDRLADIALALRKMGHKEIAAQVLDESSLCARMASEIAIGVVAMDRLLDAAKTMRISVASIAAGNE